MFADLRLDAVTNRATFDIHGVDLAIVNGLRRTLLSDIPILGFRFDERSPSITVRKNTGRLHNEFLAHRMSLIPLHFPESALETFQADDYVFELKVPNTSPSMMDVTTHHFTGSHHGEPLGAEELHAIFPCHVVSKDPVLITRLHPGEELDVVATPVLATAKEHAAFMPVSLSTFSYLADTEADRRKGPLELERGYARNAYGDPVAFRFELEPVTGLSAYYLVSKAFETLAKKALTVCNELYQASSSKVALESNDQGGADLVVADEDDTLGHLVHSLMFNRFVRDRGETEEGRTVAFVGYFAPHPLQKSVVVRALLGQRGADGDLAALKGLPLREYRALFAQGLDLVGAQVQEVLDAWKAFQAT